MLLMLGRRGLASVDSGVKSVMAELSSQLAIGPKGKRVTVTVLQLE